MSYLPPRHHLPLPAQHDAGYVLAPRGYSDSGPTATASFALAIIYSIALLVLLATTITFTCKFRSRRRINGRQVEGDTLGLVLVVGELCALSDAMIYAIFYGFMAIDKVSPVVYPALPTGEKIKNDHRWCDGE
jgi:hypothetical protein